MEKFNVIREWAFDRGIYESGDIKTQYCKLGEEYGELGRAIIKNNREALTDAIGDIVIVLTNLTKLASDHFISECKNCNGNGAYYNDLNLYVHCDECVPFKIEDCINEAYNVIADRKGEMINGSFAKATNNALGMTIIKDMEYDDLIYMFDFKRDTDMTIKLYKTIESIWLNLSAEEKIKKLEKLHNG